MKTTQTVLITIFCVAVFWFGGRIAIAALGQLPSSTSTVATDTSSTPAITSTPTATAAPIIKATATPASVGYIYWSKITDSNGNSIYAVADNTAVATRLWQFGETVGLHVNGVGVFDIPPGLQNVCTIPGTALAGLRVYANPHFPAAMQAAHIVCG
jgi:hypothetical protein